MAILEPPPSFAETISLPLLILNKLIVSKQISITI